MYHPTVVSRRLESALRRAAKLNRPLPDPTYHSISEAEQMVGHFNAIYDHDIGSWTRQLTKDEIDFIRNERLISRCDYAYWKARYGRIKDRSDRVVRYTPWVSQTVLVDLWAENELEGIGIEIQSLKARQLGVSREVSLAQLHRLLFYSHINAVMASSTPDKTAKLAGMMEFTLSQQPHWLVPNFDAGCRGPREAAKKSGGEWFELDTGAAVTLQSGSQVTGIARGTTPTVIHISELCEFMDPAELIDASLFKAVHPDARVFMILESTALGMNNWWHDTWLNSKKGWPSRRSR